MISYQCQACGHNGRVPDDYSGKAGACPKCGGRVDVPVADPITDVSHVPMVEIASTHDSEVVDAIKGVRDEIATANKRLLRIQDNTGCMFKIVVFWFICTLIGIVAAIITADRRRF